METKKCWLISSATYAHEYMNKATIEVLETIYNIVQDMGGEVDLYYNTLSPDFNGWSDDGLLNIEVNTLTIDDEENAVQITYLANGIKFVEELKYCEDFNYNQWLEILQLLTEIYTRSKK